MSTRKPAKRTTAKKLCSSIIVKEGLKKDGSLKKGYRYAEGGKIVKAKPVKKVAAKKKPTSKLGAAKTSKKSHLTKKFNGKIYEWASRSPFKDFAEKEAEVFRKKGYFVRLVNEATSGTSKGHGHWLVYISKK